MTIRAPSSTSLNRSSNSADAERHRQTVGGSGAVAIRGRRQGRRGHGPCRPAAFKKLENALGSATADMKLLGEVAHTIRDKGNLVYAQDRGNTARCQKICAPSRRASASR